MKENLKDDIMTWSLCEIHVSLSLKTIVLGPGHRHSYTYISLAALSTRQATVLSGGCSKGDTTYNLSYLLSGPSWEKPADLVFIRSVVGECEPFHWTWLTFSFRLFVLRVKDSIPEPRAYLLVEECGPEENIWRGKRLCLSFLVRSSFLLKKFKQSLLCLDWSRTM